MGIDSGRLVWCICFWQMPGVGCWVRSELHLPRFIGLSAVGWVFGGVLVPVGGCPMVVLGLVGGVFVSAKGSGLCEGFGVVGGWD